MLGDVSPAKVPERTTSAESDTDDPDFSPERFHLEGDIINSDSNDGNRSEEEVDEDVEEDIGSASDNDADAATSDEECQIVEVEEGAVVELAGWPDGPSSATIGQTKDILLASQWSAIDDIASPDNTVQLMNKGDFIARGVATKLPNATKFSILVMPPEEELEMMTTLIARERGLPQRGKSNPLEQILVREALSLSKRGLSKVYKTAINFYGIEVAKGKKTQKQLLSKRALAFAKHNAPYKNLIDAYKKKQEKTKEKKRQTTMDKHLGDEADQGSTPSVVTVEPATKKLLTPAASPVSVSAADASTVASSADNPDKAVDSKKSIAAKNSVTVVGCDELTSSCRQKRSAPDVDSGRPLKKSMVIIVTDDPSQLRWVLDSTFDSRS